MPRLFNTEVPQSAVCTVAKLHGFQVTEDMATNGKYITGAIIEHCRYCGEQRIYRKYKGNIDNKQHVQDHLRDTLQPTGRTARLFEWLYGRVKNNKGETERKDE